MKFYSEKTKELYETEADLTKAEVAYDEKHSKELARKKERAEAAKKVEDAFKEADKAKKNAMDLLTQFCKTYGSFRTQIDSETLNDIKPSVFSSIFDLFNF